MCHKVLVVKIASNSRLCRSPCQNPPSANFVDKELTNGLLGTFTENSGFLTPISQAFSCIPMLSVDLALTLAPIVVPTLNSNNELFKQFIKAYLETQIQLPAPAQIEPHECPLKVCFPKLNLGNLHIVYYKDY